VVAFSLHSGFSGGPHDKTRAGQSRELGGLQISSPPPPRILLLHLRTCCTLLQALKIAQGREEKEQIKSVDRGIPLWQFRVAAQAARALPRRRTHIKPPVERGLKLVQQGSPTDPGSVSLPFFYDAIPSGVGFKERMGDSRFRVTYSGRRIFSERGSGLLKREVRL